MRPQSSTTRGNAECAGSQIGGGEGRQRDQACGAGDGRHDESKEIIEHRASDEFLVPDRSTFGEEYFNLPEDEGVPFEGGAVMGLLVPDGAPGTPDGPSGCLPICETTATAAPIGLGSVCVAALSCASLATTSFHRWVDVRHRLQDGFECCLSDGVWPPRDVNEMSDAHIAPSVMVENLQV